jgi:predicted secreted protein
MKVVLVPHCALNQNARQAGCAESPAAVTGLVEGLIRRDVGIVQMPCPELLVIGLDRAAVHIRSALDSRPARAACRLLARDLVYQVRQYLSCGVRVLGILGKNGSPSCGVETTWRHEQGPGMGVFVEELRAELDAQGVKIEMVGIMDAEPSEALAAVDRWLSEGPPAQNLRSGSGPCPTGA